MLPAPLHAHHCPKFAGRSYIVPVKSVYSHNACDSAGLEGMFKVDIASIRSTGATPMSEYASSTLALHIVCVKLQVLTC